MPKIYIKDLKYFLELEMVPVCVPTRFTKSCMLKFINSQYLQPSQTTSADSFYLKLYRYDLAAISYNQKESPCENTVWLLSYVHLTRYYA